MSMASLSADRLAANRIPFPDAGAARPNKATGAVSVKFVNAPELSEWSAKTPPASPGGPRVGYRGRGGK